MNLLRPRSLALAGLALNGSIGLILTGLEESVEVEVGRACESDASAASLRKGVSDLVTFHISVSPGTHNGGQGAGGGEDRTGEMEQKPVCMGPAGGLRCVDRALVVDKDVDRREFITSETRGHERTDKLKSNESATLLVNAQG